ncbi:hypothetical protein [Microbacterium sp. bgisy207]|uniref:hypothetical protein n=1 Tax=Microbacterium sp. bgisy207 TaxID=3413800 RepID=UPI003EBAD6A9
MKHVHYAGRSLFMHDDTAQALIDYARVLSEHQTADAITVPAVSAEGNRVSATLLLSEATAFIVESVAGGITVEPDHAALEEIQRRTARLDGAQGAAPDDPWPLEL